MRLQWYIQVIATTDTEVQCMVMHDEQVIANVGISKKSNDITYTMDGITGVVQSLSELAGLVRDKLESEA